MYEDDRKIEVRIKPEADDRTRHLSSQLSDLLNSPLFNGKRASVRPESIAVT